MKKTTPGENRVQTVDRISKGGENMPLLLNATILTAAVSGAATYLIGRYRHKANKYFAYKRILENPRIKEGARFKGIYSEGAPEPLIPECILESFGYGEMLFRVVEKDHELHGAIITLTVLEFEKLHPFIIQRDA
ncbi:hypothetical protein EPICR_10366 [Candidatus Desulfarcum epimagneticum]|uniref:Uncharacterized protein n=1 Tax=uncultured Desulfobacteraceae bacterium TaxID=218296 RepID=A0A484HI43_9BACT|nr:hypothetical protein EPICR_10366 [uncultured Desulfobacteraceae bacterium]